MKLSISNIAWDKKYDERIFSLLKKNNYYGIEFAPTIICDNPYSDTREILEYFENLYSTHGLVPSSMQSIWYGIEGNIFNINDQKSLINHTKNVIDLASQLQCNNIVFGCPKQRNNPDNLGYEYVIDFFNELGNYASEKNTVLSIEPNPSIYGTNFLNTTESAVDFIVNNKLDTIKINIDLGTIINNKEDLSIIENNIDLINHIHISEPFLKEIKISNLHYELFRTLNKLKYSKFVSIEMGNNDIDIVEKIISKISEVYNLTLKEVFYENNKA